MSIYDKIADIQMELLDMEFEQKEVSMVNTWVWKY